MIAVWPNGILTFPRMLKKNVEEKQQRKEKMEHQKTTSNQWTVPVEEDPETGDKILTFPQDLLDQAGWKEGDTIEWIDLKNGSWQLKKKVV